LTAAGVLGVGALKLDELLALAICCVLIVIGCLVILTNVEVEWIEDEDGRQRRRRLRITRRRLPRD